MVNYQQYNGSTWGWSGGYGYAYERRENLRFDYGSALIAHPPAATNLPPCVANSLEQFRGTCGSVTMSYDPDGNVTGDGTRS